MWITSASGDLLNLSLATRLYVDARGRLLAEFLSGDVEIAPVGAIDIQAVLATIRQRLPDYQDVLAATPITP